MNQAIHAARRTPGMLRATRSTASRTATSGRKIGVFRNATAATTANWKKRTSTSLKYFRITSALLPVSRCCVSEDVLRWGVRLR